MELKQIASFQVDHRKLTEGMYTSRVDGDVVTYDIRMVRPNCGDYLGYGAIHSFEHLFATYVRSGALSDRVILNYLREPGDILPWDSEQAAERPRVVLSNKYGRLPEEGGGHPQTV